MIESILLVVFITTISGPMVHTQQLDSMVDCIRIQTVIQQRSAEFSAFCFPLNHSYSENKYLEPPTKTTGSKIKQ